MFSILGNDRLESAIKDIEQYKIYAALDIVNIHLKHFIEQLKPNVDNTAQKLEEYYALLHEAKDMLENAGTHETGEQVKLVDVAKERIESAIKKMGEIENSCSMVSKEMNCLK